MKEIKGLKQQVNDLKESMEFTQNYPDQKVAGVEKKKLHVWNSNEWNVWLPNRSQLCQW